MPTGASGVSRVRRLPQVGVRRWITFPNPALRSKALNRSEPTLTKRKILGFSRETSMQVFAGQVSQQHARKLKRES